MAPISAGVNLHLEASVPQPPAQITFSSLPGWLALDELDINIPLAMLDGFISPLPSEALSHEDELEIL